MNSLRRQINLLERKINAENFIIRQQLKALTGRLNSISIATFMLGSFVIGYVFSRRKTWGQLLTRLVLLPLVLHRYYGNIKLILPKRKSHLH